jgi:hypothetical protein
VLVTKTLRTLLITSTVALGVLLPSAAQAQPVLDPPAEHCVAGTHANEFGQCVPNAPVPKPSPCIQLLPGWPCLRLL